MFINRAAAGRLAKIVGKDKIPWVVPYRLGNLAHMLLQGFLFPKHLHCAVCKNDPAFFALLWRGEIIAEISAHLPLLKLITDVNAAVLPVNIMPA